MRGSFAPQSWLVSATKSQMSLNSSIKPTQMFIVLKLQFLHHERCVRSSMSHDDDDEISWFVIPKGKHLCLSKHFHTSLHNFSQNLHNARAKFFLFCHSCTCIPLRSLQQKIYFAHESIGLRERKLKRPSDAHRREIERQRKKITFSAQASNRSVNSAFFIINLHFSH